MTRSKYTNLMKIDRYDGMMAIKARLLDNVRDKVLQELPTKLREEVLGGVATETDEAFCKIDKLISQLLDTTTRRQTNDWLNHINAKIQAMVKEAYEEIDKQYPSI
jgi:hypothetical protein